MNCPFCGDCISAGAVKCPKCSEYIGETLSYDEEMKLRARKNTKESYSLAHIGRSLPRKWRYSWIWNFVVFLVLVAVIIGLYFLNKQR